MAEGDAEDKTEEPTAKRLQDAADRGQFAQSREVASFLLMGAALALVALALPAAGADLTQTLQTLMRLSPELSVGAEGGDLRRLLAGLLLALAMPIAIFLGGLLLVAILSGVIQTGGATSSDPLIPKLERISPLSGMKRQFSAQTLLEFLKGLIKIVVVGAIAVGVIVPAFDAPEGMVALTVPALAETLHALLVRLMLAVVIAVAVIAGLDYFWQRLSHIRKLRMSRQELKEEMKDSDGNPEVKQRRRQLQHDRARKRMMAEVPKADVVIVNPTHFAVALRYQPGRDVAPVLVAKGVDFLALRIRRLAEESGVAVVENPPVARALHAAVDVDQQIPEEFYRAVAEIIGVLYRQKGKGTGRATRPA